jgi:sulfur relay (sulfurtransferase) DsrC/TusE family protein
MEKSWEQQWQFGRSRVGNHSIIIKTTVMSQEAKTKTFPNESLAQMWVDDPANDAIKISIAPDPVGVLLTYKTKHDTA